MNRARCGENCAGRAVRKSWGLYLAAVFLLSLTTSIPAIATNLVTNGSFESNSGNGEIGFNTSATGWSIPSSPNYTFLFGPGTADTTGATGRDGLLALWGPGNGAANGLPPTSPDGGFFIAQDSDFQQAAIDQTINGLTPGNSYTVSFWWAAAQQFTFNGESHSQWEVSLGSQTQSTTLFDLPNHGFSGWMHESFTYTATSSSEVLSFFANGSPQVPPFALLDGVTLNASSTVAEPGTITLMATGLMGAIGAVRRYRAKKRS